MLEQNPSEAVQNNIVGTVILAELAIKYNVEKFIFTSSDKAVNPSSVMGCSKRICEIYLQNLQSNTKFIITRFGNVLGSVGSVIPLFEKQISEGGPVTVTHPEMTRYFMSITEAALLTIEACKLGIGNEIFIFKMDEPIKIVDLAKQMIGNRDINITFTGLRPGEKLHEELFIETEITSHDKLLIVKNKTYDINIQELIDISYTFDSLTIIKKMQEFVPEFVSNNPEFYSICK
jgi:FlaA1/EpsC-like NDP-sugar epimerase